MFFFNHFVLLFSEYLVREFSGFSLAEILARSELMENLKIRQVANIKLGNTHKIDYSKDFFCK